jgi:DNA-binding winged helix-turn-helix (wHTH) protein
MDLESRELRKNGLRLRLSGQPFQVLAVLVERAGEVVTREELHSKLWKADTFVDFDHGLNNAIARSREMLDDSPGEPRYVETIPKLGYRFVAPLLDPRPHVTLAPVVESRGTPQQKEGGSSAGGQVDAIPKRGLAVTRSRLWLAGAIVAVSAAIPLVPLIRSGNKTTAPRAITSIAVLPLKNMSGDAAQEYLADGVTEELIGRLAGIHNLRVISRTSVMRFKETKLSAPEIAKALQVDALVECSMVQVGTRIRVHA